MKSRLYISILLILELSNPDIIIFEWKTGCLLNNIRSPRVEIILEAPRVEIILEAPRVEIILWLIVFEYIFLFSNPDFVYFQLIISCAP